MAGGGIGGFLVELKAEIGMRHDFQSNLHDFLAHHGQQPAFDLLGPEPGLARSQALTPLAISYREAANPISDLQPADRYAILAKPARLALEWCEWYQSTSLIR